MYVQLQILEANIAATGRSSKPPNPFARVGLNAVNHVKTRTVKKQWDPAWDETFTLHAPDIDAHIYLEVRHDTWMPGAHILGMAQVRLSTILRATNSNDAEKITMDLAKTLTVSKPNSNSTSPPFQSTIGHVTLRVWSVDLANAGRTALESAHKHSDPRAIEEAKTPAASLFGTHPTEQEKDKDVGGSLAEIMKQLDVLVRLVDVAAQIHPYVNLAWQMISSVFKLVQGQFARDQKLTDLLVTMETIYTFVDTVRSIPEKLNSLETTIRSILIQTVECVMFIREYSGMGFCGRVLTGIWADDQITHFVQTFVMLKDSFDSELSLQTTLVSFRIDENVEKIARAQNLAKLVPNEMDDPMRGECLPNTRIDMINTITEWATSPDVKRNVFWLYGFAGVGKSTISTTVANMFRELGRLGAFVFFNRDVSARNDPAAVIRTLAYQLGEFDPRIGNAIAKVIENTPSIRQSPLRWQFRKLILEPLSTLDTLSREGPVLIIFDALDECGSPQTRKDLLDVLATEMGKLPPTFRVLITGRAELDIEGALADSPNVRRATFDLTSHANSDDVLAYIHFRMVSIRAKNKFLDLPPDWPGARIALLAERASGLFVWASTACYFIENGQDPEQRVADLTSARAYATAEAALDGIYTTALEVAGNWTDESFASDFREILGIVLTSSFPLCARTIDALNGADPNNAGGKRKRPCLHTIQHLGCVVQWAREEPIRVMHPSFADFLTNRTRCGRDAWFVDKQVHHVRMAQLCLSRLADGLQENYCKVMVMMDMSDAMRDELCEQVPEDVAYACEQWIRHAVQASEVEDVGRVAKLVEEFLRVHLLHWIEAMSILRKARQTIGLLISLRDWLQKNTPEPASDSEFLELASDGIRFCQAFMNLIEEHPLLVYTSALPFTPTNTLIYRIYHKPGVYPSIAGGFREQWSPLLTEFGLDNGALHVVQFSPNMRQLLAVTGSALRVWDAASGAQLSEMHNPDGFALTMGNYDNTAALTQAIWAPDGTRVASAAHNGRVRLWDALAGSQICEAITIHDLAVYGLTFSPDGQQLLTASKDRRIGAFDAHSGAPIREPFVAHGRAVLCISYFPGGTAFVTGSRDETLRIWDAQSFRLLRRLEGHTGAITCVAITSDNSRIISGAEDCTIRVWDAHSGTILLGPLRGHRSAVWGLALAPGDLHVASASKDCSVRSWNLSTGAEHSRPVRNLGRPVRSVSWGRSGGVEAIATGSTKDGRVRVFDIVSVGSMSPAKKHKGVVALLAFSPLDTDGRLRLASCGQDRTVRVWDANTMEPLLEPLEVGWNLKALNFSFDGMQIIAEAHGDDGVTVWDAQSGQRLVPSDASASVPKDAFRLPASLSLKLGRYVCVAENGLLPDGDKKILAKLPHMAPIKAARSFENRLALGLANGSIVVMRFPSL